MWDVGGPTNILNHQMTAQPCRGALSTPLPTKGIPLGRGKIADPQSDIVRIPRLPHEEFDCRKLQMAENYAPLVRFQLGAQITQPTASQRHLQKTPATRRGTIERRKETGPHMEPNRVVFDESPYGCGGYVRIQLRVPSEPTRFESHSGRRIGG
jgi:hypothetical protein